GHDLLIDAFARCGAAQGMDLVILGEGPLKGALQARAASLGVGARVRFPGFQPNPWAWFSRAKLFILPSRWEGFGNVVAEAMASGVATMVTDCDFGPREQVAHGYSGWVVTHGDAGAIGAGLETLLPNSALRAQLVAGGTARARDFDVDLIARTYGTYFREHLGVLLGRPAVQSRRVIAVATQPRESLV
ncbi:MAG: glycosyltransferase, partial [Pseudomonadota bacterium]|nr:glycosyltransferase [Pseudomonadota bacterium]